MAERSNILRSVVAHAASPAVALMAEFKHLAHETAAAAVKMDAAEELFEWVDPPEELFCREDDMATLRWHVWDVEYKTKRRWWGEEERIKRLREDDYGGLNTDINRRAAVRRDEIVAAWDAWEAAKESAEERCGLTAAADEWRDASRRYEAFRLRLIHMRTTDLDVIAVKAAVVGERYSYMNDVVYLDGAIGSHLERQDDEEALSFSIIRDFALRSGSAA